MNLAGKYSDPQLLIAYEQRKINLARSFFGKKQFMRIMELLEMKLNPAVFTGEYQRLRSERFPPDGAASP
jgi:hypothetical protein